MALFREFCGVKKEIDSAKKRVRVLVSDDSVDHDGEIIALDAWDSRLDEYRKNPIFCWGHPLGDRSATPERLLGKAVEIDRTAEGLVALFEYAVDLNPLARMCWDLMEADILKAYSVGGQPMKQVSWWDSEAAISALNPKYAEALKAGACQNVITDIELWEISQVLKGSNRNALRRAVEDGTVSKSVIAPILGREIPILVPVPKAIAPAEEIEPPIDMEELEAEIHAVPKRSALMPVSNGQIVDGQNFKIPLKKAPEAALEPDEEAELMEALQGNPEALDAVLDLIEDLGLAD